MSLLISIVDKLRHIYLQLLVHLQHYGGGEVVLLVVVEGGVLDGEEEGDEGLALLIG